MTKKILYILSIALMLVACQGRNDDKLTAPRPVQLSLGPARANQGQWVADALDCEKILTYRVVITTPTDRRIVRVIDKVLSSPVELDPMDEVILNPGKYHVYAFANMDFAYLNSLGLKEDGIVPENIGTLRYTVPNGFDATPDAEGHLQGSLIRVSDFATSGAYIPMTGLAPQVIEVTERINQTFHIEVRRLFAKVEFVFRNATEHDLQVNRIGISDLTPNSEGGSILLMNYEENRNSINLPYGMKTATFSHTLATPDIVYAAGEQVRESYYVLESRSNSVTNAFDLIFSVTRKGEAETGAEADYMRYALTDPVTLTLIHRNDWLTIPITFSEWQMRLVARSYPPIGGYAETELDEQNSDEFVVTFVGGGDFVIRPFIRKYYDGSEWFGIDEKTKIVGTPTIEVTDGPSKLFINDPVLTETGEIMGTMGVFPGRSACVTLQVNVVESNDPLVTKTLKRKIYITQK